MIDIQEKKERILSFLKTTGPNLPVRAAKAAGIEPFLGSALLSELLSERKVKMSHLKIGKSVLYLIEGQEEQLENFADSFKSGERDAYLKLKKSKVLKDIEEEPAIRVALRGLKDFAIPFKFNGEIMWRYAFVPESEIKEILEGDSKEEEKKEVDEDKEIVEEPETEVVEEPEEISKEPEIEIEIAEGDSKEEETIESKPKKEEKVVESIFDEPEEAPKPEFFTEVMKFLKSKDIEFVEEIQTEKKEVVGKVSISSTLGNIEFLLIAKNKKSVSKDEIAASIQRATYSKMPCLIIIRKEPTKAIQSIVEENNLIKIEVMD